MIKTIIREALIWLQLIRRPDLIGQIQISHPRAEALDQGSLIVVKDGELSKWACFRCPGGCGEKIQLSLNERRRPRWSVDMDWLGPANTVALCTPNQLLPVPLLADSWDCNLVSRQPGKVEEELELT